MMFLACVWIYQSIFRARNVLCDSYQPNIIIDSSIGTDSCVHANNSTIDHSRDIT